MISSYVISVSSIYLFFVLFLFILVGLSESGGSSSSSSKVEEMRRKKAELEKKAKEMREGPAATAGAATVSRIKGKK
jgi:hypothetical protein